MNIPFTVLTKLSILLGLYGFLVDITQYQPTLSPRVDFECHNYYLSLNLRQFEINITLRNNITSGELSHPPPRSLKVT